MKYKQFISYILRHFWFWPIEFWMRPLTVIDRYKENVWPEFIASLLGGGLWGAFIGTLLWLINVDIHSTWIMAELIIIVVVILIIGEMSTKILFAGPVAEIITIALIIEGATLIDGVAIGAVAGMVVGVGAIILSKEWEMSDEVATITSVVIIIGAIVSDEILAMAVIIAVSTSGILVVISIIEKIILGIIIPMVYILIVGFAFFPLTPINQIPAWGIVLPLFFGIGIIAVFFRNYIGGLWKIKKTRNIKLKKAKQSALLSIFYSLFLIISVGLWVASFFVSEDLSQKFTILAIFFAIAPIIGTGLLFYPLILFITFWQYRSKQIQNFTPAKLHQTAPFRWQTFAYPLDYVPIFSN